MRRQGDWIIFGPNSILRRMDLFDDMQWSFNHSSSPHGKSAAAGLSTNRATSAAYAEEEEGGAVPPSFDKDSIAAAAPQGGPILRVNTETGNIDIFTSSGRKLLRMQAPPEVRAHIWGCGWSMEESPLLVASGGSAQGSAFLVGDLKTGTFEKFKITDPAKAMPTHGIFRPFGIFLLFNSTEEDETSPPMLHALLLPDNFPPEQYKHETLKEHISSVDCIEAVSRADLDCGKALLYVCGVDAKGEGGNHCLFSVDCETGDVEKMQIQFNDNSMYFTKMSLCPEAERFALLLSDGTLWIASANLENLELDIKLGITFDPTVFQWCGTKFVHLLFNADRIETNEEEEYIFPCHWSLLIPTPKDEEELPTGYNNIMTSLASAASASASASSEGGGGGGDSLVGNVSFGSQFASSGGLPTYELIKWDLESPSGFVLTTTEIDGLRVITDSSNILFEVVPVCLESACHLRAGTVSSCLCRVLQDSHEVLSPALLESVVRLDHLLGGRTMQALTFKDSSSSSSSATAAAASSGGGGGSAVPNAAITLSDVLEELLDAANAEYNPRAQAAFLKIVAEVTELLSRNRYENIGGGGSGSSSSATSAASGGGGSADAISSSAHHTLMLSGIVPGGYTGIDSDTMKDVCRRLRMLNDMRDPFGAGMLMTVRQYQQLSGTSDKTMGGKEALVVIHRLIHHGDFLHAARLVHYFGTKMEMVALQWAIAKVQHSRNSEMTHALLSDALRRFPSVDTVDVANAAVAANNTQLAVDLLQSEKHSASEVLLLLQLGYTDLAVEKALGSDDGELVAEILLKLMSEFPRSQLISALMRYPDPSQNIFMTVCENLGDDKEKNDLCREFCEHARREDAYINMVLSKKFVQGIRENAMLMSRLAVEQIDDNEVEVRRFSHWKPSDPPVAQIDIGTSADVQGIASSSGDEVAAKNWNLHMYLQTEQQRLGDEHGDTDVVGMPVLHTLRWMYRNDEDPPANELVSRFGVSERAVILAKLEAWSEVGKWENLDQLAGITINKVGSPSAAAGGGGNSKSSSSSSNNANSKTPPLPSGVLQTFIETCHSNGQHDRAVALTGKLSSLAEKMEWYITLDEFQRAADAAFEASNVDMLRQLRRRSQNPQMQKYIEQRIAQLS